MTNVETYIKNFKQTGHYYHRFDKIGMPNIELYSSEFSASLYPIDSQPFISSSGRIFLTANLSENKYDNNKIENLYDVTISSVNNTNTSSMIDIENIINSYNDLLADKISLQNQLNSLTQLIDSNFNFENP